MSFFKSAPRCPTIDGTSGAKDVGPTNLSQKSGFVKRALTGGGAHCRFCPLQAKTLYPTISRLRAFATIRLYPYRRLLVSLLAFAEICFPVILSARLYHGGVWLSSERFSILISVCPPAARSCTAPAGKRRTNASAESFFSHFIFATRFQIYIYHNYYFLSILSFPRRFSPAAFRRPAASLFAQKPPQS